MQKMEMTMHPAIAVRNLAKKYDEGATGTLALRGIDLDVHAGELLMLMGPSLTRPSPISSASTGWTKLQCSPL